MASFQDPTIHLWVCHAHSCNICPLMPVGQQGALACSPILLGEAPRCYPSLCFLHPFQGEGHPPAAQLGCAVGMAAGRASPSPAQPGQDAGTADLLTAVEVTAEVLPDRRMRWSPLVPPMFKGAC